MEELRKRIKENQNISDELKCNIATLTDALTTVFPDYDYSNLGDILSTLVILKNDKLDDYSAYNKDSNELSINTRKVFEDRIDLQHLFMQKMLSISTHKEEKSNQMNGFFKGMTESITSLVNVDESGKKLNPLESLGVSIFSKIVSPKTLIDSYMNDDLSLLLIELESLGIPSIDFNVAMDAFNNANTDFLGLEKALNLMFEKRMSFGVKSGIINEDNLDKIYADFSEMLVTNKAELISLYPLHDFSKMGSLEPIKEEVNLSISRVERNIGSSETNYYK